MNDKYNNSICQYHYYYYCHLDPGLEAEARTLEAEAEARTHEAEAEARTLEARTEAIKF